MKFNLVAPLLIMASFLFGCGESNPYIGSWEAKVDTSSETGRALQVVGALSGINFTGFTMIFTETEAISFDGKNTQKLPIVYKNGENGYMFSHNGGVTWDQCTFRDKNTMSCAKDGLTLLLVRTK